MSHNKEYDRLKSVVTKPEIWSAYTSDMLWTDDHISKRMLAFHLDPDSESASRSHSFIDRSARWMADRFDLPSGKSVVDFGCGPGLYTSRFCRAGAVVTGIDFSERSLNYAAAQSKKCNQDISYIKGNYLEVEPGGRYDLITMIYCDYGALSPEQRTLLLNKFKRILKEGGKVLLDVFSIHAYDRRGEASSLEPNLMGGFWHREDYIGISQTWKYDKEKVILDKYHIATPRDTFTVYNWLQYFSREGLAREISSQGFRISEWYSDVSGRPLEGDSATMAVVLEVEDAGC